MIDGFVLAGGQSRRMGFDKARAAWERVPLAVAAARSLAPICTRIALVRRQNDGLRWCWEDGSPVEVVHEPDDFPSHPLWGIVRACEVANTELIAVVPCDVPQISAACWQRLVDRAPAVAIDEGGQIHPLVTVIPRAWGVEARVLAAAGASARRFARDCARVEIPGAQLADHDDPSTLAPDPVAELLRRVPSSDPDARARIARGERLRLAARGIVARGDP